MVRPSASFQIKISLNLPEPGEYGVDIFVNQPKKKRSFCHACQYLVLYLADDEKSLFVSEITKGQVLDDMDGDVFEQEEKEVIS